MANIRPSNGGSWLNAGSWWFPFVPSEPAGLQRFSPTFFPAVPSPSTTPLFLWCHCFQASRSWEHRRLNALQLAPLLLTGRRSWNVRSLNAQVRQCFPSEEPTDLIRHPPPIQITLQLGLTVVKASAWTPWTWIITYILHCSAHTLQRDRCKTLKLLLIFYSPFPLNMFYNLSSLR